MPNHPQSKTPEYQFNDGKLYVMTRNGLVTYDGRRATISDAFSPKTLLILGVVIGYIPLLVCLNIAASIIESRGGMFDLIFLGFMTLLFAGGAARFARTGRQVLRTVSSADLPSADLNDPAYKAHLHGIYQRESRKSANLPVGMSWIRKLVGWLVLLAFGGMALAGLAFSVMHVMNAVEKAKVREERRAEKKLDPATRQQNLLAKLAKVPERPETAEKRADIMEDLGAVSVEQGNTSSGARYYQAALDLRFGEMDTIATSKDFENLVTKLGHNAIWLVETQVALDPKTNLTPLEKQLLDSVAGGSHRLNLKTYNEQRGLVRQISKTLKRRDYKDLTAYTHDRIAVLNNASEGERRAGLESLLHELFQTIVQQRNGA